MTLATLNRNAEDVRVLAVIVVAAELRHAEGEIFQADFMVGADYAALQQRPKALNRIGMDGANKVLANFVITDDARIVGVEPPCMAGLSGRGGAQ